MYYVGEELLLWDSVAIKGPIYLINSALLCFYLSVLSSNGIIP